ELSRTGLRGVERDFEFSSALASGASQLLVQIAARNHLPASRRAHPALAARSTRQKIPDNALALRLHVHRFRDKIAFSCATRGRERLGWQYFAGSWRYTRPLRRGSSAADRSTGFSDIVDRHGKAR